MAHLTIVNEPREVCGIKYVDVETEYGIHTMLESRVKLLNALYGTGLNELGVRAIMDLVADFSTDNQHENEIE